MPQYTMNNEGKIFYVWSILILTTVFYFFVYDKLLILAFEPIDSAHIKVLKRCGIYFLGIVYIIGLLRISYLKKKKKDKKKEKVNAE